MTRASRSVISSSNLEGTHGLEALLREQTAGPCRNPPFHINPLVEAPALVDAEGARDLPRAPVRGLVDHAFRQGGRLLASAVLRGARPRQDVRRICRTR